MAKPVKPAKKKKSGNLLVHVVILLLLATVGWRLYALQGQVRAAQAERDQYARHVVSIQCPSGRKFPSGKGGGGTSSPWHSRRHPASTAAQHGQ